MPGGSYRPMPVIRQPEPERPLQGEAAVRMPGTCRSATAPLLPVIRFIGHPETGHYSDVACGEEWPLVARLLPSGYS
jgi:hypothetical protein